MSYDDDLDNMILAMVDAPSSSPSHRGRAVPDDDSTRGRFRSRRHLMSDDEENDDDLADPWGPNLMGDVRDREYLESLPELEREAILAERAEQRQKLEERRALRQKLREQREARYPSTRSSVTDKKRRMQALKVKHGARRGGNRYGSSDSEYEPDSSSKKRRVDHDDKRNGRNRSSSPNYDSLYSPTRGVDVRAPSPTQQNMFRDPPITIEGLLAMQLTRDQVEKFCYSDFFDELARDSFVRLRIGDQNGQSLYRVAQIVEVTEYKRVYTLHRTRTNKSFCMKHGAAEKVFLADIFSNTPFTESEYQRWRVTCENELVPLPTEADSKRKADEIARAEAHHFTEEEVALMLKKKRAVRGGMPRNLAAEKAELIKKRQIAQSKDDQVALAELDRKLEDLEETIAENSKFSLSDSSLGSRSGATKKRVIASSMLASAMGHKNIFKDPAQPGTAAAAASLSMTTVPTFTLETPPLPPVDAPEDEETSVTDLFTKGPKVDIDLDI